MKRYLFIVLLFGCSLLFAQNIVPNPSFETMTACPSTSSQLPNATPWQPAKYSPEYMHTCGANIYCVLPNNYWGNEPAATGNACMGGLCYGSFASSYLADLREMAYAPLTVPLVMGQTYYVSFKVNLADKSSHACNNLGVRFENGYTSAHVIDNYADVYTTSVITQTNGWTTITGTFVASGNYTGIYVGNFFNDANTTVQVMGPVQIGWNAYYFWDDICVSPTPGVCNTVLAGTIDDVFATTEDGKYADVTWQVSPDMRPSEMFVQRSFDGNVFEKVRTVTPASASETEFTIKDLPMSLDEWVYYRVQVVAEDGSMHTSKVVSVKMDKEGFELFSLAPNPVVGNNPLQIRFATGLSEGGSLEIYDQIGKLVYQQDITAIGLSPQIEISTAEFESGIYQVVFNSNGKTEHKVLAINK